MEKEEMKKLLLVLLSMALVLSMSGVVAGAYDGTTTDYSDAQTGTVFDAVEVYLTIAEKYTVKIPAGFEFTYSETEQTYISGGGVGIDIDLIGENEVVSLSVTGTNYGLGTDGAGWYLKTDNENDDTQYYKYIMGVTEGQNDHINANSPGLLANGDTLFEVPYTNKDLVLKSLHLRMIDVPVDAAKYTDELTFKVYVGPSTA